MNNDRELAKQIIVEIIRQAGGSMDLKTAVFKAFYHAHLKFANAQPAYLSAWPIVRMPNGPGIHRFDSLILDLVAEKQVSVDKILCGYHEAYRYQLGPNASECELLPEGAQESIAFGVAHVINKTAAQVSKESHEVSRAWRQSNNGQELNIYLDALSDEEYCDYTSRAKELSNILDSVVNI